jgi:phage minor structural protein
MIKYPILYRPEEELFTSYGLAVLQNAWDIEINQVINNEYSLKFNCPVDDKFLSVINDAYFVKCDQTVFTIEKVTYSKDVNGKLMAQFDCEHIMFSVRNGYINFSDHQGETTLEVVSDLLNFIDLPNRFTPLSSMDNIDNLTFSFRNKNPMECIREICDKFGGEIFCTNMPNNLGQFTFGIVYPQYDNDYLYTGGGLGSFKLDIQIRDGKNIKSLKKEIDKTNQLTKLHVFGKGAMTFEGITITVQKDGSTPQSPTIYVPVGQDYFEDATAFNKVVGYFSFPNIINKQELYWAGKAKWDELRVGRINYTIEIVDLRYLSQFKGFDDFQIGDVVTFIDNDFTSNQKQPLRVTQYKRFPLEPERNSAVFSTIRNTIFYTFNEFLKTNDVVKNATNGNGEILPNQLADSNIKKVVVQDDGFNPEYGGVFISGLWRNGLLMARENEGTSESRLFFEDNGTVWIYNQIGAGFVWSASDTRPNIKFSNDAIHEVLCSFDKLNALADVDIDYISGNPPNGSVLYWSDFDGKWIVAPFRLEISSPVNGQTLKYNSSTQTWKNSF